MPEEPSIPQRLTSLFGTTSPVAVVTGSGADRLGKAVALRFAARGYRVALHANRSLDLAHETAESLRAEGIDAEAFASDLADPQQVRAFHDAALERFGRADVLVNCAAIWEPKKLEQVEAEDVRRHFEINGLGTFLCCRAFGLTMAAQATGGAIVNFGDWAVARPYADYAAYFPSKGAVVAITRSLAVELASRNPRVRVNAVLPGPTLLPEDADETLRQAVIRQSLLKREGTPDDVADAVVFLAEGPFLTGVALPVDGGRSIYAEVVDGGSI
ncbi:MAG TPA: SDR family oxidoreductase [Pirellulaceae bacterium]|jgi:pteridine reductase|nr:SDR family oxidoreductase [Pirellulaceae bacterium]